MRIGSANDGAGDRQRAAALAFLCLSLTVDPRVVVAEDRVTIRGENGVGKAVFIGSVMEYTGGLLRIRTGDQLREFDANRVVDLQTGRLQSHIDGLKAFDSGKPEDAANLLNSALKDESRTWMRREILAALVRVELAMERHAAAARHFLALEASDPTTRHFRLIPLDWSTDPPDAALAAEARSWIAAGANDTARLLGASLLLFDPAASADAARILDELASRTDARIYTLARAQLWRRTLARGKVPEGEITRWEDRVSDIPEPLRGGAWYLIGRAWSEIGNPDRAAAALLWLPLVYDADPGLASKAATLAADQLSNIGRTADAVTLYREVTARFPSTSSAKLAQARLELLATEAGPSR